MSKVIYSRGLIRVKIISNGIYYKVISDYELERLKNPQTEEDKQVLENLPS